LYSGFHPLPFIVRFLIGHKNTKKHAAKQKKCAKISLFASILLISQSKKIINTNEALWK